MLFKLLLLAAVILLAVTENTAPYRGHRLLSVSAQTQEQLEGLAALEDDSELLLDFWTGPSRTGATKILVSPRQLGKTVKRLREIGLTPTILNHDIQNLVDEERTWIDRSRAMSRNSPQNILTKYLTFSEVEEYLAGLATQYPDKVTIRAYGNTIQGNPLTEVKIVSSIGDEPKPAIWIEAATHAREWITVSAALNLITNLVTGTDGGSDLLEKFDWYITPIHNPDGYIHSWSTNGRFWRKNREGSRFCPGTDLNRNWDINWQGPGSSSSPCSETYHGTGPNSARETAALRDAVLTTPNVVAFFSFHCFSQYILLPNGYTTEKPENYKELEMMANNSAAEIYKVDGKSFKVGTPPDILYVASGGAYDYFYDQGIKYSFTYELRPDNNHGSEGFILDVAQIPVATKEAWVSIKSFAEQINVKLQGH